MEAAASCLADELPSTTESAAAGRALPRRTWQSVAGGP